MPFIAGKLRPLACILITALILSFNGCVTKKEADARARLAFITGQQQATMRLQQQQQFRGPSVTFVGPVQNFIVGWHEGLTLTEAILSARYSGTVDPSVINIRRNGETIAVDPQKLLTGENVVLQAGDIIDLQP